MEKRIYEEKIELAKKAIKRGRLSVTDIAETLALPVETVRELSPGYLAMMELSESAERNGISNMRLDEINAEIEASRAERAARRENEAVMFPKFLDGEPVPEGYFDPPNPYVSAPTRKVDLGALTAYARKNGKNYWELTKEEVQQFET